MATTARRKKAEALLDAGVSAFGGGASLGASYYFQGWQDGDIELYRTDGESFQLIDVRPGPLSSNPRGMTAYQDELYFVTSGSGTFVCAGDSRPFGPGDALFVAAGEEHRFESFSDDFAAWVVFWGPEGGELPD